MSIPQIQRVFIAGLTLFLSACDNEPKLSDEVITKIAFVQCDKTFEKVIKYEFPDYANFRQLIFNQSGAAAARQALKKIEEKQYAEAIDKLRLNGIPVDPKNIEQVEKLLYQSIQSHLKKIIANRTDLNDYKNDLTNIDLELTTGKMRGASSCLSIIKEEFSKVLLK